MSLIKTEVTNRVGIVQLNNGVTNAISFALVTELTKHLKAIENEASAVVLTGNSKFFSIGWNLPELIQFDRATMSDFVHRFQEMMLTLATLPIPTVCAMNGHAAAGGLILALGCDYRIARATKVKVGLNESRLGVSIPWIADLLLKQLVGYNSARKISCEGEIIDVDQALSLGLVDEIHQQDSVLELAVAKAVELSAIPASAYAAIKQSHLEDAVAQFHAKVQEKTDQFLDLWFADATRVLLKKAAEKF
jgi:Delta3-Delta2-enoyl-CoA isomerase